MVNAVLFEDDQRFSQIQNHFDFGFNAQRGKIGVTLLKICEAFLSSLHDKLHSLACLVFTCLKILHNSMRNGQHKIIDNVPMLGIHYFVF